MKAPGVPPDWKPEIYVYRDKSYNNRNRSHLPAPAASQRWLLFGAGSCLFGTAPNPNVWPVQVFFPFIFIDIPWAWPDIPATHHHPTRHQLCATRGGCIIVFSIQDRFRTYGMREVVLVNLRFLAFYGASFLVVDFIMVFTAYLVGCFILLYRGYFNN